MQCLLSELLGDAVGKVPIHLHGKVPIHLHTDSSNLHKSVMRSTLAENPRLRTEIVKLQESLKSGELAEFHKVKGKEMIADCLTKCGAPAFKLMNILKTCTF